MTHPDDNATRSLADEAFQNSEARARLILDSAAEAICGCDSLGSCLFANSSAARMLGYDDPAELLGKNLHSMEHHTRKDGAPYPIEECPIYIGFQKGEGVHRDDELYWRKDGTSFPVEYWSHLVIREGKTLGAVITFIDITERKRAEEALRKSEERWRSVYENSAVGVALTDLNGRFLAVNRAYEKMLGYSEQELRKLTFLEITEEGYRDSNWELVNELLDQRRQQFQIEKQYRHKNGTLRWVSNNVSLVPGTESVPRFIMALSEDITQRKHAEEALRKSEERNRSLLQINNAIITNLTQEALLHAISVVLQRVVSFDRCAITIYQPERDTFRFLAVEGDLISDYYQAGREDIRSETCASWVFEHQQPLVRRDLEKQGTYANEHRLVAEGIQSLCALPLVFQGKCIGTLGLISRERDLYSDEDAAFLQEVANQITLAIQNMQSYQEIHSLKARLEKENVYLREELSTEHNFDEIVGNSPALLGALHAVEQVAATDATVLIYGETGTGKELVARAIHNRSSRSARALVSVNCSAISAGLVESELFGHMKGAFTGALERRIGRFELAHGGTIFLDEIGELSLETQVKLLRVLQEHEFEPVGSSHSLRVDVRVIAATNRNLPEAIRAGRFRSDLFYRLNVVALELPPLRERRSDIPQLVTFFLTRLSKRFGKKIDGVCRESMENLVNYPWPGNIRELQNVIERAVVLSAGSTLRLDRHLMPVTASWTGVRSPEVDAPDIRQAEHPSRKPLPTLQEMERSHILAALEQSDGVVDGPKGAAKVLNLHPNTLRHRMNKLGIKKSGHRRS